MELLDQPSPDDTPIKIVSETEVATVFSRSVIILLVVMQLSESSYSVILYVLVISQAHLFNTMTCQPERVTKHENIYEIKLV